ncbi:MAG: hypothetical protein K9J06_03710 [Flavobacteriales bacterium]|nr:hypothetical protein [Flavobacteriales bacterium]
MSPEADKVLNTEETFGLGGQMLAEGRTVKLRLGGYSMWPFLLPGDVATIAPVKADEVLLGDVLVFDRGDRWIAHRLISKETKGKNHVLRTRGDSCINEDAPFKEEKLRGKVVEVQRGRRVFRLDHLRAQRLGRMMVTTSDVSSPVIHALLLAWRLPFRIWSRVLPLFA